MKLAQHHENAAATKASMVILRWAEQTGKNVLIDRLMDKETDFVIEPRSMAAYTAEKWEGWSVFQDVVINEKLLHYIKRKQKKHHRTKRIFLNECALFERELLPLIKMLRKEWPKAQIYCISTPRGGWKLFEAGMPGLEFDMLCARLEMGKLHDWFYSRIANQELPTKNKSENEIIDEDLAGWRDII